MTANTTGGDSGSWGIDRAGHNNRPDRLYRVLRGVVRGALRGFYRTVEVTGREHVPTGQATILASTHPNSIIDPLLLGLFEDRQVAFCARDGLFKVPLFGRILRSVGAIPIQRRQDKGGGSVDNADAFTACRELLQGGGVLSIFPEGKTHARYRVHKIKTGVARIALDAVDPDDPDSSDVQIVPVALNYLVRQAFRSDVHVAFGPPISIKEFVARNAPASDNEPDGTERPSRVKTLTGRLEEHLKSLSIHIDQVEDERLIAQVTAIIVDIRRERGLDVGGQTPAERTALVQRVLDAYRWVQEEFPEEAGELRRRLERYVEERAALGLGGESAVFGHRSERRQAQLASKHRRRFLVLGAPVAIFGMLQSAPPYLLLRAALRVIKPRKDRAALNKLLLGSLLFGGFWAAQTSIVSVFFGPILGSLYGTALPFLALFGLRYMTEIRLHRLTLSGIRALWSETERLAQLRRERTELQTALSELRDRYLNHIDRPDHAAAS